MRARMVMRILPIAIVAVVGSGLTYFAQAAPTVTPADKIVSDAPADMSMSFMVYDRATGDAALQHDAHRQYRSASVVKLLIALDYLESHGPGYRIPPADRTRLESMLRSSDDDAASYLWTQDGWDAIVKRMVMTIGLVDTAPPANRGMWGYTATSASDVVKTYRYILDVANPRYRDFIMDNLHQSTRCGTDGFDQSFGIPSAVPPPRAVKQGWSGFGGSPAPGTACAETDSPTPSPESGDSASPRWADNGTLTTDGIEASRTDLRESSAGPDIDLTRPAMHTTGTLGQDDREIMVVLTLEPVGTSWNESAHRITAVTTELYQIEQSQGGSQLG